MTQEAFDELFGKNLNDQQLQAVHAVDGPVLLLAVPGSGKTTVLVDRLGYMVRCRGITPGSILTMTYTVAATLEMKKRFAEKYGDAYAGDMTICTINGLSARIIAGYAQHRGRSWPLALLTNEEAARIVGDIYMDLHGEYPGENTIRDIRTAITYIKNRMLSQDEIAEADLGVDRLPQFYGLYSQALKEQQRMDFDDQMVYALTILRQHPQILQKLQEQYRYICVDESQDTSRIQHEIIGLLAEKNRNLFMVGDEDQSIYGFRAAYPEALLHFRETYPEAVVLLMERNYRSSREITEAANHFVKENRFRYDKRICPVHGSGKPVQILSALTRNDQFAYLYQVARSCDRETAVLYRNNDSALPLIDWFERTGVPYNCKKFEEAFFSHRIVTDIVDILNFAADPMDAERFLRIYYKFGFPVSREAARYACSRSASGGRTIPEELMHSPDLTDYGRDGAGDLQRVLAGLHEHSAAAALNLIWNVLGYNSYVVRNQLDGGKYDILQMLAAREKSPESFLKRLDTLKQLIHDHQNRQENLFTLSTIHSSKGLEYERVYLLDVLDGILPGKLRKDLKSEQDTQRYEEDRRAFYVAMTRAKEELYLFTCADRDSRFVREVAEKLPRPKADAGDVFAALPENLCGKTCTHRQFGKGKVTVCGDGEVLMDYGRRHYERMSLGQLLDSRVVPAEEPTELPDPELPPLHPGSAVTHKSFGPGVVMKLEGDVAQIRFQDGEIRRILLSMTLRQHILQPGKKTRG